MNNASTLESPPATSASGAAPRRRVVDAPMRMFHWLFALSFLGAYVTAEGERWRALHISLGYTLAGLLAFRLLYGLFGPRQARLGALWRRLSGLPAWLRALPVAVSVAVSVALPAAWRSGPGARPVSAPDGTPNVAAPTLASLGRSGQNLAMALAVAALLAWVLPLTLSGVAVFHEWAPGGLLDALEEAHEFLGEGFALLVLAHLALIAGLSLWRRQNQALPMLTGYTQGRGPDLVKRVHRPLAVLLLVAVLGWLAWEWQQAPAGLVPWGGANSPGAEQGQGLGRHEHEGFGGADD